MSSSRGGLPSLVDLNLALLVPTSALLHVYLSPYTKVEESFNIQALHDWLFLGPRRIGKFDHIIFSGAVPRSFVPSIILSAFSYPFLLILKLLGQIQTSADIQYYLRCILALLWSCALLVFVHRVVPRIKIAFLTGEAQATHVKLCAQRTLIIVSACQFHLPFWAGRTTPNGLAMPGVLVALALLLPRGIAHERAQLSGLALLVFLAIIYRLELMCLLGGCGLYLLHSRLHVWREDTDPHPVESFGMIAAVIQAIVTVSAVLTTGLDTVIWKSPKWMVPEFAAAQFNVVEGKSVEWGISPWHAYLTSSVPKLLSFALPLTVIGSLMVLLNLIKPGEETKPKRPARGMFSRIDQVKATELSGSVPLGVFLVLPAIHVGLLSALGHKEWRFVAYVVPLLNVLAAVGASALLFPSSFRGLSRLPRPIKGVLPLAPLLLLALTIGTTTVSTLASQVNYPGGVALARLHAHESDAVDQVRNVHIDVLPAMTGVTLFQSIHLTRPANPLFGLPSLLSQTPPSEAWTYDKTEDLPLTREAWAGYTHLLSIFPQCHLPLKDENGSPIADLFEPISGPDSSVAEFAGIYLGRRPQAPTAGKAKGLEWLNFELPLGLGSMRSFEAAGSEEWVRIQGVSLRLGRSGNRGISVGFKLRQVVWICQRKAGMV